MKTGPLEVFFHLSKKSGSFYTTLNVISNPLEVRNEKDIFYLFYLITCSDRRMQYE